MYPIDYKYEFISMTRYYGSTVQLIRQFKKLYIYEIQIIFTSSIEKKRVLKYLDHFYLEIPEELSEQKAFWDELYDYIGFSYENYIDISNNLACIDLLLSILFKHKYIKRNSTVLDFGCGSGLSLRSNWRNICNIIGYESNHTMYSIARSRGLKVYLPEMIDTCLDNSINAVFASFVFHMYIDYDVLKCISLKLKDKTAWSLNFYKDINKDKTIQMFQNLGYHHECVGKMKKIGSVYIFYR